MVATLLPVDRTAQRIRVNGEISNASGIYELYGHNRAVYKRLRRLKRERMILQKQCDHLGKEDGFCPKCFQLDAGVSTAVRNSTFLLLWEDISTWYSQHTEKKLR